MNLVNMQEVLGIAIQIEQNASDFYRKAAAKHSDGIADKLLQLAEMEDHHKQLFADMRDAAAKQKATTPSGNLPDEGGLFMSAITSNFRIEGSPSVADSLTGNETLKEILQTGLSLEKESVLFYLGIKDTVSDKATKDVIQQVIDEEKKHIVVFAEELERVG